MPTSPAHAALTRARQVVPQAVASPGFATATDGDPMAFWYWFTCPSCGYITKASGARANGLAASVDTMVCRDCDELVDVLIEKTSAWSLQGSVLQPKRAV